MKYNIEGNIDFFTELYKSLDDDDTQNSIEEDNNCLITQLPLTDKFVEMSCGHKFNYIPLYNDILNHKNKFNSMEATSSALKRDEIRCPYCRKKQKTLLPYYEEMGLKKNHGINFFDEDFEKELSKNPSSHLYPVCDYLTPIQHVNTELDGSQDNPKFLKCFHVGYKINPMYFDDTNDINCNKFYCYAHKQIIIKQHKKDKIQKEMEVKKQEKLEAKQKEKEDKQKIKEELQKLVKESKLKAKMDAKTNKNNNGVNEVITNSQNLENGCSQLIKSGDKKGLNCGLCIFNDNLCKRHYNLKNKKTIKNEIIEIIETIPKTI